MTLTKDELRELACAINAWCDDKPIQVRRVDGPWTDLQGDPQFNRTDLRWRVKPARQERWVLEHPDGVETVHKSIVQAKANAGMYPVITHFIQSDEVIGEKKEAVKPMEIYVQCYSNGEIGDRIYKSFPEACSLKTVTTTIKHFREVIE